MLNLFLSVVLSGSPSVDCSTGVCGTSVQRTVNRNVQVSVERQRWTPLKNLVQNIRDRRSSLRGSRGCK